MAVKRNLDEQAAIARAEDDRCWCTIERRYDRALRGLPR